MFIRNYNCCIYLNTILEVITNYEVVLPTILHSDSVKVLIPLEIQQSLGASYSILFVN